MKLLKFVLPMPALGVVVSLALVGLAASHGAYGLALASLAVAGVFALAGYGVYQEYRDERSRVEMIHV